MGTCTPLAGGASVCKEEEKMVDELVRRTAALPGFDADKAQKSVSIVLTKINKHIPNDLSASFFAAIPGSSRLVAQPDDIHGALPGGLGGMVMSALGNLLGDDGNILIETYAELEREGVSLDEARAFGMTFAEFAHERAGKQLVGEMVMAAPGLSDTLAQHIETLDFSSKVHGLLDSLPSQPSRARTLHEASASSKLISRATA
jgi:hypothetical protein